MRAELDKLPKARLGREDAEAGVTFYERHSFSRSEMDYKDLVFHHAGITHADAMRDLNSMLRNAWFDVELELRGSTYGAADDEVELVFAERLALWLRNHASYVAHVAAGGDVEPSQVKARLGGLEACIEGHRLYAVRHHEMLGDYCERMATRLDLRAAELRHELSYAN